MPLYNSSVPTRTQDQVIAEGVQRLVRWAFRTMPKQMSMTATGTLSTLSDGGPLRLCELADREGTTQPGMTALVNRLAESGYVRRVADPTDGRAALVHITAQGQRVLDERRAARTAALRAEISALPAAYRDALAHAIGAIDYLTDPARRSNT
jgi:DNA-binding MarR family transcriptional regulator